MSDDTPKLTKRQALVLGALGLAGFASESAAADVKSVPRDLGEVTKTVVPYHGSEPHGTLLISNAERVLLHVLKGASAARYEISVGRDGFLWTGATVVGRKAKWPGWWPPQEMRQRQPELPAYVPPGPYNPLGARAIYLYEGGRDTLYRIHGTNNSATVGGFETSGCFRLSNADAIELYEQVMPGAPVIVV
ncbi:MAG: L,D-transpeptidase [Pseudomonadota bacterium]